MDYLVKKEDGESNAVALQRLHPKPGFFLVFLASEFNEQWHALAPSREKILELFEGGIFHEKLDRLLAKDLSLAAADYKNRYHVLLENGQQPRAETGLNAMLNRLSKLEEGIVEDHQDAVNREIRWLLKAENLEDGTSKKVQGLETLIEEYRKKLESYDDGEDVEEARILAKRLEQLELVKDQLSKKKLVNLEGYIQSLLALELAHLLFKWKRSELLAKVSQRTGEVHSQERTKRLFLEGDAFLDEDRTEEERAFLAARISWDDIIESVRDHIALSGLWHLDVLKSLDPESDSISRGQVNVRMAHVAEEILGAEAFRDLVEQLIEKMTESGGEPHVYSTPKRDVVVKIGEVELARKSISDSTKAKAMEFLIKQMGFNDEDGEE